jgi:predicted RNA-binding Zn-ribbon protein involved in translation (DUF1610 family)
MMECSYRLCPRCARAVPSAAQETYCPNDGEKLLERCPHCRTRIHNPYARHCTGCGLEFAQLLQTKKSNSRS